ncbi:MAG: trigger factor [Acholeplasmatales bacterium]|jgi:trigger factor|nr:trigger factor [Acholeplasmataceae bacterium]MDY0115708.1 trigger factor [Acholeplasmatales bacterium]MCK9234614.1 trigger factor [Acholeplasmataceae bacterium]MCK9289633.1 trigger factor [Acholeplasmataceae bacterium]MCK9427613.1 trigger factor [Acholeplasmataceae bacterium]
MKFEKTAKNYAKFTFEVKPEEFNHGLEYAFNKIKEKVEIKGFRKGHVPQNIYEQKFGVETLYEDALNHVIIHRYDDIFKEKSVVIVGNPKVDIDFKTVSRDNPFSISLTFPIKPEVVLGDYVGVEVKKKDVSVNEDEIEMRVNNLLSKNNALKIKENGLLEKGDTAIFDFEGFLNDEPFEGGKAENHQLEIGSNSFIPGFEDKMIGMKANEERELELSFPEDYHAEELKGQDVVFKVKLHEVKTKEKEELTDEFVKTLKKDNVNTVLELKESIKNEIASEKEISEKNRIVGTAVEFAVKNAKVDIPQEMIEIEKENIYKQTESQAKQYGLEMETYLQFSGLTKEQFEEKILVQAQEKVLTSLVIEAIANKEDFPVSEEEINDKYQEFANHYNLSVKQVKEQLAEDVITNEVRFSKAINFLEENVKEI